MSTPIVIPAAPTVDVDVAGLALRLCFTPGAMVQAARSGVEFIKDAAALEAAGDAGDLATLYPLLGRILYVLAIPYQVGVKLEDVDAALMRTGPDAVGGILSAITAALPTAASASGEGGEGKPPAPPAKVQKPRRAR